MVKAQFSKELPLAFSLAVVIHLGLILALSFLFSSAKAIQSKEGLLPREPQFDEITLVFEPRVPKLIIPPSPTELSQEGRTEKKYRFANSEQNTESPSEDSLLIGGAGSVASSDAQAKTGDSRMAAQSGEEKSKDGLSSVSSNFSEEQEVVPEQPTFVEPKVADQVIEEEMQKPKVVEPEATQISKTEIKGEITITGEGNLDVKSSGVGRYGRGVKKIIETIWQRNQLGYREHIAPGIIIYRFHIDPNGRVYNKKLVKMKGASQKLWGHIVRDVDSAIIPPMTEVVRRELNGESLVLTLTFKY